MDFQGTDIRELEIKKEGAHKRCNNCDRFMLELVDTPALLVFEDDFLSDFDEAQLPPNFDPANLPDGLCPDCEANPDWINQVL